jgi:Domain of unknown function (DUF4351)
MFRSCVYLRDQYKLPVLPIGLYLKVGFDGIGIDVYLETLWELETVRFQYLYVGLPALDAVKYVHGDNWLGVALAALMKMPKDQAESLGAEAFRRISEAPVTDRKRFFLTEYVKTYLPIDETQKHELKKLLDTEEYSGVRAMNKSWFDEAEEKGRRHVLRELMEERFGPLPAAVTERLRGLSLSELMPLSKAILRAQSLSELGLDKEKK